MNFFPKYFLQPKPLPPQLQMSPFNSKTHLMDLRVSLYNFRDMNSVAISRRTKDTFATIHLCGGLHMVFRRFWRGDRSSPTDHTVEYIEN